MLKQVEQLGVLEVPGIYLLEELKDSFRISNNISLADVFLKTLKSFLDSSTNRGNIKIETGIYMFSTNFLKEDPESLRFQERFRSLCKTVWDCTCSFYDHQCEKNWNLRILAVTSVAKYDEQHFVSACCNYDNNRSFQFHDGLGASGFVQDIQLEKLINEHLNVQQAFFIASVKSASK